MDDLISRSALLNEYRDFKDMDCPSGHTVTADYMIELVEDAPAVDAEVVRHGRWIHPKDHVVTNEFFCSECNKRTVSLRPINRQPNGALLADENGNFYYPPTMKYCSECGAKMDAEVQDETATDKK